MKEKNKHKERGKPALFLLKKFSISGNFLAA
jgi:hypothetical protein